MVKKILVRGTVILVGLIAALCLVIGLQPSEYSLQRSTTIAAPPADVFALVNDLQAWDGWSPWTKLDPQARTTISNPSAGEGATFSWAGNEQIGEGKLTITDSRPDELVEVEQVFVKPFAGRARMLFTLAPEAGGTRITWLLDGENDFVGKAMCLVMNLDKTLGPGFEEGLANMKRKAEKRGE